MLVLSRRIGETLIIDDQIEVQILDINRGQVRIGIAAPKEVNIVRSELLARTPEVPTSEPRASNRHPYARRGAGHSNDKI